MAEETPDDEDIEFPAISPAPVLIALLNLVHAIVIWAVAVTVHLPRYLLFSKQRRITITEKEPTGETRRWCRENPGLRGFVLELQTPSNTFKAYKCNATEPHPVKKRLRRRQVLVSLSDGPAREQFVRENG